MTTTSPSTTRENLLNFTPAEAEKRLAGFFGDRGIPGYRAKQVVRRLWVNPAPDFEAMTELPKAVREELALSFDLPRLSIAARQRSSDGTEKFLFMLPDRPAIQATALPEGQRPTS